MHRIVIVGGGAGGLALATQLGKRLGRKKLAEQVRNLPWYPSAFEQASKAGEDMGEIADEAGEEDGDE